MSLTKARRAELEQELLATMDRVDALRLEHREAQRAAREELSRHEKKVRELRDLLSGREAEQTTIPGTETGTVKPRPVAPPKKEPAGKSAAGITWTAEDNDSRTGRSRSQARVYRVSAVKVTATGKLNWGWHLPGSALHHGGSSGFSTAAEAMAAAEGHELHHWPKEPKKAQPIVKKNAGPYRPKGEITRWIADERARKVPTFVIEQTGIRTKTGVIAKYGERAVFEKGRPCPRDRDGLQSWERKPAKAPKKAARATRRGASMDAKPKWERVGGRYVDQHPDTGLVMVPGAGGAWSLCGIRGGERVPTMIGPIRDLHRALVCTYGELWAMAEKLSAAELPRLTAEDVKDQLCLDCGIAAGKPSKGCWECDHGRSKPKEAVA